jgi:hypothetical protein
VRDADRDQSQDEQECAEGDLGEAARLHARHYGAGARGAKEKTGLLGLGKWLAALAGRQGGASGRCVPRRSLGTSYERARLAPLPLTSELLCPRKRKTVAGVIRDGLFSLVGDA